MRPIAVVSLFSFTLFVSAALLFLIQPMFAKFVLPLFGSTPAVWNAAMVFFQMALLAAYLYAHEATRRLGVRRQAALHVGLLALPLLVLPIAVPRDFVPSPEGSPVLELLGLLAVTVGLPFFVVASTAPLLQRWLSDTDHPAAADPYFLYRASNLGSILGLLAYPLALERTLRLADQGWLWSAGYGLLVALVLACAVVVWRSGPAHGRSAQRPAASSPHADDTHPSPVRRLRWIFLAFVPSSLMLGVTTYLTTDIAPIPLFWAIPLSLYLLSFSIVFSPGPRALSLHRWMILALPPLALLVAILLVVEARELLWLVLPVHLLAFFVAAMVCHGRLAGDRPAATSLTGFYLCVALGGALGGVFNAIVAPAVFDSLLEYPLVVVLACLCVPPRAPRFGPGRLARVLDLALPIAIGGGAALLLMVVSYYGDVVSLGGGETTEFEQGVALSVAAGVALTFVRRPLRFGLAAAAIVIAGLLPTGYEETELYQARSFFGIYRVTASADGLTHSLTHGTTLHGEESFRSGLALEPLTYYTRAGPVGQLMGTLRPAMTRRAAVIGLGTGTMACYARRGDRWTFYEIDPLVERIARDPRLFTFLRDCPGRYDVVLGDARLSLARAPRRRYGLIVLDAFTSDAIPIHLLTREALALYRSRLRDGGVLALHISNLYLDLEPVVGRLARDAGLVCRATQGIDSDWAAMAVRERDLGAPSIDARWHDCRRDGGAAWSDDFSNLVGAFDL
ncbi:MAG: fused MFS/spermidine synthase [Actinomycetota bacterium]|nr:fused MFS/spermidine synthase [Actinomycetota bacterium]